MTRMDEGEEQAPTDYVNLTGVLGGPMSHADGVQVLRPVRPLNEEPLDLSVGFTTLNVVRDRHLPDGVALLTAKCPVCDGRGITFADGLCPSGCLAGLQVRTIRA